jgi:hypothetical protein
MEVVMKIALIATIAGFALALLNMPVQAQTGCKYTVKWSQPMTPSPAYNACASEMTATFDYNVFWGTGGYSAVHCVVINSGWDAYYWATNENYGDGQKIETHHCTNLTNHQLQIEVTTDLDPGKKFGIHYLQADYATGNPQNPEP